MGNAGIATFFSLTKGPHDLWRDGRAKSNHEMMILLFNLRSRRVGINRVLSIYMPVLERDANEELMVLLQRAEHDY